MSKRALANARAEARVPYAAAIRAREDLLLAIQELLDGVEWTPATLEDIAQLMVNAGYRIRDLDDVDRKPMRVKGGVGE